MSGAEPDLGRKFPVLGIPRLLRDDWVTSPIYRDTEGAGAPDAGGHPRHQHDHGCPRLAERRSNDRERKTVVWGRSGWSNVREKVRLNVPGWPNRKYEVALNTAILG